MSSNDSVLRTKPVEDVLAQAGDAGSEGEGTRLSRRLGAKDLMGFGIGIVIGTGIFTLTGIEAKNHAGPGVVISFAIAGVVSLLAALCYAELAARYQAPRLRGPFNLEARRAAGFENTAEKISGVRIVNAGSICTFALRAAARNRDHWSGHPRVSCTRPLRPMGRSMKSNLPKPRRS